MLIFVGYPIVSNIILSMQNVTVRNLVKGEKAFIGLKNYSTLFKDAVFWQSLKNTLVFTVSCLIVQFIIGFALALFFNRKFKFAKPIRGLLMIPWMIPMTITSLMFKFMFSTKVGIINYFLQAIGIISENIEWLTDPKTAMIAVVITNIWIGIPFNMILISTGLTSINEELYESASIDGASKVQKFFKITLPLMRSTIESILVLGFIYTFKVYDLVWVMTSGGPVNSTHLMSTYSYKLSFEKFQYSMGSAVANVLLVVLLLVGILYLKITMQGEGKNER
ncbi:MAG: sugar ABC transporter permease [Treponema sp.]|nr:sugar ABC transporter permease [Candidatus Treponema caballi]